MGNPLLKDHVDTDMWDWKKIAGVLGITLGFLVGGIFAANKVHNDQQEAIVQELAVKDGQIADMRDSINLLLQQMESLEYTSEFMEESRQLIHSLLTADFQSKFLGIDYTLEYQVPVIITGTDEHAVEYSTEKNLVYRQFESVIDTFPLDLYGRVEIDPYGFKPTDIWINKK